MRPVTHKLIPFTPDQVPSIRLHREKVLAEGLESLGKGHKKKRSGTGTKKQRTQKVMLDAKAREQLASLDPATRAFLEKAMK